MSKNKVAVVAVISFFDNEMHQKAVRIDSEGTWKDALFEAMKAEIWGEGDNMNDVTEYDKWICDMPDDLEKARGDFRNGEMDVSVIFLNRED